MMLRLVLILMLLGMALAAAPGASVARQVDPAFDAALQAFRNGDHQAAAEAFRLHAETRPDGPNATAALAMAGKAWYRTGEFGRAANALEDFLREHPDSRYVDDVQATLTMARAALAAADLEPSEIGIVLSLEGEDVLQTQALFNGIRLAVDLHNGETDRPARMVFRRIGADPASAGAAVRTLAAEGVRVVIGALFSDQAVEAAAAAEAAGVVFVAPLATDDAVTSGRSLAFQANPSIETRGRLMARMAVNGLLMNTVATVAGSDPLGLSIRMAEAFRDQALELGAEVPIEIVMESAADWYRLDTFLSADTLREVRGLYLPIAGAQTDRLAGALLSGLDRIRAGVRVLGNAEWHGIPLGSQATRYALTYLNDYLPDTSQTAVAAFDSTYMAFAGERPNRLVHAGFDVTRFVLQATLDTGLDADATDIADALRMWPPWEGVAHRIHFDGGQVNTAAFYHRYRDGRLELFR